MTVQWNCFRKSLAIFASIHLAQHLSKYYRYLMESLENSDTDTFVLQEKFPPNTANRLVVANALFHTCC